jgi:hypothetical protein
MKLMDQNAAAEFLGISVQEVIKLVDAEFLPRQTKGGRFIFYRTELEEFEKSLENPKNINFATFIIGSFEFALFPSEDGGPSMNLGFMGKAGYGGEDFEFDKLIDHLIFNTLVEDPVSRNDRIVNLERSRDCLRRQIFKMEQALEEF